MSCVTIPHGIGIDCSGSMGGIKNIWLADFDQSVALTGEGENVRAHIVDASQWYKFVTRKNVSSLVSTMNIDDANGVNYISSELSLTFAHMNASKRYVINALRAGNMKAVIEDNNGEAWLLGFDNPIIMTGGTAQTGAAVGDGNNYQVTITDTSIDLPYAIDEESLTNLKEDAQD